MTNWAWRFGVAVSLIASLITASTVGIASHASSFSSFPITATPKPSATPTSKSTSASQSAAAKAAAAKAAAAKAAAAKTTFAKAAATKAAAAKAAATKAAAAKAAAAKAAAAKAAAEAKALADTNALADAKAAAEAKVAADALAAAEQAAAQARQNQSYTSSQPPPPPLAAPAIALTAVSESVRVNTLISGFAVTSTGGAIASLSISPTAPAGTTFNTLTGGLSGTPTVTVAQTTFTITATNSSGSATATYVLSVLPIPLAAPAFSLSRTSQSVQLNTAIESVTVSSTGGTIASFAISPQAPAGTTFNTSTGVLSGTPSAAQISTTYTITATNSAGAATATFSLAVLAPRLVVSRLPQGPVNFQPFRLQPEITLQTLAGDTIADSATPVTASVSLGGTLTGTQTVTSVGGVATFTNLGMNGGVGAPYTITFSAPGYSSVSQSVTFREWMVGDTGPGGGIIFYANYSGFACGQTLNQTCRYLESAPSTGTLAWVDSPGRWSSVEIGRVRVNVGEPGVAGGGTQIGRGASNSVSFTFLNDGDTPQPFETVITRYRGPNNLTDWFLPSLDELRELYRQRALVGGFGAGFYWSSSWEDNTNQAWYLWDFAGTALAGKMALDDPTKLAAFRAIRSF